MWKPKIFFILILSTDAYTFYFIIIFYFIKKKWELTWKKEKWLPFWYFQWNSVVMESAAAVVSSYNFICIDLMNGSVTVDQLHFRQKDNCNCCYFAVLRRKNITVLFSNVYENIRDKKTDVNFIRAGANVPKIQNSLSYPDAIQ